MIGSLMICARADRNKITLNGVTAATRVSDPAIGATSNDGPLGIT
jgi:hypothetical protein